LRSAPWWDAAIVVVEQTHKKLEIWQEQGRTEPVDRVIVRAIKEVGGPSFYALLILAVSFLPVLALGRRGRKIIPAARLYQDAGDARRGGSGDNSQTPRCA